MSKFRTLVEGVLKEYWGHNPYDDDDGEDVYWDWLEEQDYREGYAVFLGKDDKGHDLFASADKSVPEDPEYTPSTDVYGGDPMLPDVFEYSWNNAAEEEEAKKKAEEFANEWKQIFPDAQTEIVKVYSKDEDGNEFHRTKEEVYPFEDWDYNQYKDDLMWTAAEQKWESDNER